MSLKKRPPSEETFALLALFTPDSVIEGPARTNIE
jgi:hypothetical protein